MYLIYCFFMLLCCSVSNLMADSESYRHPMGICVFDIDGTLTEPGSMEAVKTCIDLGYGIGINTGEDKNTAQRSMNAIYNGLSERGHSLDPLHPKEGVRYYDFILNLYADKPVDDLLKIIGDGSSTPSATHALKPAYPGDVNLDTLFQYSGGCKEGGMYHCTNYPYKHEGLESIAQFYYPEYKRSVAGVYPPAVSDKINKCVVLFDDQLSTVERYANNLQEKGLSEKSQRFRAVYINEPGWKIDNEENARNTVCRVIKNMPDECQLQELNMHCEG